MSISRDALPDGGVATNPPAQTPLRRDKRYSATEVPWLRRARFKYGADVQVLDISASGIRLTHFDVLPIGAPVVLEFTTPTGRLSVPARVIHCRDVETSGWVAYEIGCRFARTLPWFAADISGTPAHDTFDVLGAAGPGQTATMSRGEPLWAEYMIASCCELAAGVWLGVGVVLLLAEWAERLFS